MFYDMIFKSYTATLCMLTPDNRYRCQIQCRPQRTVAKIQQSKPLVNRIIATLHEQQIKGLSNPLTNHIITCLAIQRDKANYHFNN
jgi:hypothetical protein